MTGRQKYGDELHAALKAVEDDAFRMLEIADGAFNEFHDAERAIAYVKASQHLLKQARLTLFGERAGA